MNNVLSIDWNNIKESTYNNDIKKAQEIAKKIDPKIYELYKQVIKSSMEGSPVISDATRVINNWSLITEKDDNMSKVADTLINELLTFEDIVSLFYFKKEDKENFWIVIKKKSFKHAKKYIETIRELTLKEDKEVGYLIFDSCNIDKVRNQVNMENNDVVEYF